MEETPHTKNDDGMYKPDTFQKNCNTFINYVASAGRPVDAVDCILHFMCSGKKLQT